MLEKTPKPTKKSELASGHAIPETKIIIRPPNFQHATVKIVGNVPYVQKEGTIARRKTRKREPKDFDAVYRGAMHISTEGWPGIPCSALRAAMISACRTVDYAMTRAKLSLFIEPDGFDREDEQPLTRLYGEPRMFKMAVRLASGTADIAARPLFDRGWYAMVTLRWDADAFSATDVINLLSRAGVHCGIGAGRPDSRESAGMGFGTFEVEA